MPEASSSLDDLKRQALRLAGSLRARHFAAVAVLAAALLGVAGVRVLATPRLQPAPDGPRLQIQVVAPVEPAIAPGSVMEVGDLVEGFEGPPPAAPRVERAVYAPWDEGEDEAGPLPARSSPERYAGEAVLHTPAQPAPPARDWRDTRVGRWFGFDAPDRDYRAEREARRARVEARIERERERREVRWYRSDGRDDDRDRPDLRRDEYEDEASSEPVG